LFKEVPGVSKKKKDVEIDAEKLEKAIPFLCIAGPKKGNNAEYIRMHRKMQKISWYQKDIRLKDVREALKRFADWVNES
jgi:hypothetical protein